MAFIPQNKDAIINLIHSWTGKFSYELLLQKIQLEFGLEKAPSRQSLIFHDDIKLAIKVKREELRNAKEQAIHQANLAISTSDRLSEALEKYKDSDATLHELLKLITKLEDENIKLHTENKTLKIKNSNLLERFARWQYNLSRMDGVDLNKLDLKYLDQGLLKKNRK